MFANLKKKIESEVGDLSRLTPSLRSITHSEKLTPLSSRHNSVSSLASETSYSNKVSGPLSPSDPSQGLYGGGPSKLDNGSRSDNNSQQQKMKRVFEEKLQTQELDFAWRLNSKDEEISKLQKQVEHLNNVLHSKEFETQQKLVRVQEDMDSLEGFSQQENAKIKHLLLNREEELSQLRATVMMRDSAISDYESQIKSVTVENDRLRKSLDEVVGRQGNFGSPKDNEEDKKKSKLNEELIANLESEKQALQQSLKSKDSLIEKLQSEVRTIKQEADAAADSLRKENSFVLKELKEVTSKLDKISKEYENQNSINAKLQQELESTRSTIESKDMELTEALTAARKLQETNGALTLQLVSKAQESSANELGALQTEFGALKSNFNHIERELEAKEELTKKLEKEVQGFKSQAEAIKEQSEMEKTKLLQELEDKSSRCDTLSVEVDNYQRKVQETESRLKSVQDSMKQMEVEFQDQLKLEQLQKSEAVSDSTNDTVNLLQHENDKLKRTLESTTSKCTEFESQLHEKDGLISTLKSQMENYSKSQLEFDQNIAEANQALSSWKLKEKETQGKLIELEQENITLKSELDKSFTSISEFQKLVNDKEYLVNNLQSNLQNYAEEKARLEQELSKVTASFETVKIEVKECGRRIEELRQSNEKLQSDLQNSTSKVSELEVQLRGKDETISNLQSELTISLEQNIKREAEVVEATDSLNLLKPDIEAKDVEIEALKSQLTQVQLSLANSSAVDAELSRSSERIKALETELSEKEDSVSKLQNQLEEFGNVEVENSELVLQISEIQSKCDELEEENKFLKESVQPNEEDTLKRRLSELESELLDKNQILKQQSHQLQDLRRSLAKEINKNQALSESAPATETASPCNGTVTPSQASMAMSSMQPPTLPPQETDVNFMYLRSVLFKYLTTTDVQVTHQLTRVVATLLHLSEEEAHLLSQSAESRNGWMSHLITKS